MTWVAGARKNVAYPLDAIVWRGVAVEVQPAQGHARVCKGHLYEWNDSSQRSLGRLIVCTRWNSTPYIPPISRACVRHVLRGVRCAEALRARYAMIEGLESS